MSQRLLREIASWKLEAKLEDSKRYFFNKDEVDLLRTGQKCFVIGRKGTGKTAIAQHLYEEHAYDQFAVKLSFKNFPFNDLYDHSNPRYRPPNQYITLWKYLIYSSIARMMIENENIELSVRQKLSSVFPDDPFDSLNRTFAKLSGSLTIKAFGVELGAKREKPEARQSAVPLIDRVEALEHIIREYIDDATYLILFDELDEDYKDVMNPTAPQDYAALLTSLFKATQDVKTVFPVTHYRILPIVFLRDDIYEIIHDPDKAKWSDHRIDINWNNDQLRGLLAFRISRASDPEAAQPLDFVKAWRKVFLGKVRKEPNKEFNFLARRTCKRPRDFVRVMQLAAGRALVRNDELIDYHTLRNVGREVSRSFRADMEDEIEGVMPEASAVLDVVAQLRQPAFTVDQFAAVYGKETAAGRLPQRVVEDVLRVLFHFSAIGNTQGPGVERVFRYTNADATLNITHAMCVHPGLWESMQIKDDASAAAEAERSTAGAPRDAQIEEVSPPYDDDTTRPLRRRPRRRRAHPPPNSSGDTGEAGQ